MNKLIEQALILIYPDGGVEKIPILNFVFHIDYIKENLKNSPRFAKIMQDINIDDLLPLDVYKILVKNGIIVLHNYNVEVIIKDNTFLLREWPCFLVLLLEFKSKRQLLSFMKIYDFYPKELLVIYMLNNDFQEINYFEIEELMEDAKIRYNFQELKL